LQSVEGQGASADPKRSARRPVRDGRAAAWRLKLSAVSGGLRDDYNYLGVSPEALDGYDPMDLPDAGTLNASRHVMMYVTHDDWGERSGSYCVDMRDGATRVARWTVTLATKGLAEPVTLVWRGVPAGWKLVLCDPATRTRVDMTARRCHTFDVPDGERTFVVIARAAGPKAKRPAK
jgi:hypothetical protein